MQRTALFSGVLLAVCMWAVFPGVSAAAELDSAVTMDSAADTAAAAEQPANAEPMAAVAAVSPDEALANGEALASSGDVTPEAENAVAENAVAENAVAENAVAENAVAEKGAAGGLLPTVPPAAADKPLDTEMEDVKKALLELKRDLVILEEDLLFPASSQVAVFVSMDLGEFFQLDSVTLKLNGKEVTSHLYTDKQVDALYRGGVQKLFVGNVKQGGNRMTAFFTGRGPSGRDYRRATTVEFEKSFEPTFVELAIADSTAKYQPEFRAAVTN